MKYLIALLLGLLCGIALFAVGLLYNPFIGQRALSPLAVTEAETIVLSYSGAAKASVLTTNNGESRTKPHPAKVLQLWESSVRKTTASVTVLRDGGSNAAGLGIKMSSLSESTDLLHGQAIVDSVWYVYIPNRGSFFVEQQENYWDYIRDVVVPAYRSTANTWKGNWIGDLSSGPGSLGTADVTAAELENQPMLGLESLTVRAWSVSDGAIAAEGRLIIELPRASRSEEPSAAE